MVWACPRRGSGYSLTETMIATIILALAMIPVFGLITGGVVRTDVSTTATTAANIAASIMTTLLSEVVPFDELLAGIPPTTPRRHPGPASQPNLLGDQGTAPDRYQVVGRTRFSTELYLGSYPDTGPTSLAFSYFANPQVFYEDTPDYRTRFYDRVVIDPSDAPGWSPYLADHVATPTRFMRGGVRWATRSVGIGAGDSRISTQPINLLKIVLVVKWGDEWVSQQGAGTRGGAKRLGLVSFRARL